MFLMNLLSKLLTNLGEKQIVDNCKLFFAPKYVYLTAVKVGMIGANNTNLQPSKITLLHSVMCQNKESNHTKKE